MSPVPPPSRDSLIFVRTAAKAGVDPDRLRRAADRGELVRVRRGVYCDRTRWSAATERERHLLRVHAVVADARKAITVAGESAAVVWGMPLPTPPSADVTLIDRYRGGGRSEPGVVRRSSGGPPAHTVDVDGIPVTCLPRTALDVAQKLRFREAVAVVDWARWRRNPHAVSAEELEDELGGSSRRYGRSHLLRTIRFSTDLSDSFAESGARAVIHELGFVEPVLQLPLCDAQGTMFPDFAWPDVRVAAEFDGRVKYEDQRYNGGDPVEKVRLERRREGRLRRLGWTVQRLEWADVVERERLAGLLRSAGVPRA